MRLKMKRLFTVVLLLVFLLFPSGVTSKVMAYEMTEPNQVIRVAFPMQGGLTMKDENGNYNGYTYDYLQEIAQYTGWEYEFVEIPGDLNESLLTMLDMVSKGELDIMGGIVNNEQTRQMFDFPEYGYGYNYTTLCVPEENTEITENNYMAVKELRIAILRKSTYNRSKLQAFCEGNNINYTLVECDSEADILGSIQSGRANVAMGSDLMPFSNFRTIAQFNGTQFYFAVTRGNTKLVNELNRTILNIQQVKPNFDSSLHSKYFLNTTKEFYLSPAEKAYVASALPLRVAMVQTIPPIQYQDEDGAVRGISYDILERVAKETGLRFIYLSAESFENAYAMMDRGEADAVCGIPYDYDIAQRQDLMLTNAFLTAQMVGVAKTGQAEGIMGSRVAVLEGRTQFQNTGEIVVYPNPVAGMEAVATGEVDYAYMNLYSAEYHSRRRTELDLRLIPQPGDTTEFCLGIKKPANTNLISVLNMALWKLPANELEAIILQNTINLPEALTLSQFVRENTFLCMGILAGVFVILGGAGLNIIWYRMKADRKLALESQRYLRLCELANEYIFEYDCEQDTLILSKDFSRLFDLPRKLSGVSSLLNEEPKLHNTLSPGMLAVFRQMLSQAGDTEAEFSCPLPNGERRWYRSTLAIIRDQNQKAIYIIGKLADVQAEREEKEQLTQQAQLDGLTKINNSASARHLIGELLSGLECSGALLIIDIDQFKMVNDRLGHYTGDIVLKDFADLLVREADETDVVGRLGGDEFVMYLSDAAGLEAVAIQCEKLHAQARRSYASEDGAACNVTISIGAAWIQSPCGFEELYQVADKLLYQSKKEGRNRWTVAEYVPGI